MTHSIHDRIDLIEDRAEGTGYQNELFRIKVEVSELDDLIREIARDLKEDAYQMDAEDIIEVSQKLNKLSERLY